MKKKDFLSENDIKQHFPSHENKLIKGGNDNNHMSEREILYKVLFEMKNDINNLKNILNSLTKNNEQNTTIIDQHKVNITETNLQDVEISQLNDYEITSDMKNEVFDETIEENFSLETQEMNIIKKALKKHSEKRSLTAKELGISERTLYRKIKQYEL